MNYTINNFFEKEECNSIIEYADKVGKKFNYNPTEVWDCKRISDLEFNKLIIDRFIKNYKENGFKLWFSLDNFEIKDINISITKYYDNRRLDLHLDSTSQLTTVIVLNENFVDGRFMLSETQNQNDSEKYELKIGQSISFDGSKIYHGVMPVTSGIRCALNIWMTNTDFKYLKLHDNKKLI
jgi:hypothetical protein